jgi:hypothetical protein
LPSDALFYKATSPKNFDDESSEIISIVTFYLPTTILPVLKKLTITEIRIKHYL